ncbi:MAG: hypothetical protein ACRDLF_13390, partial [Solirubrobacteraceae bacterium]
DELNRVTQYRYNGDGLQTQVILPNPVTGGAGDSTTTTTDDYDLNGNLVSETNSAGATTQFFFDGLDRKSKEIDPAPSPGMLCVVKIIDGDFALSERDLLLCLKKSPSESLIT